MPTPCYAVQRHAHYVIAHDYTATRRNVPMRCQDRAMPRQRSAFQRHATTVPRETKLCHHTTTRYITVPCHNRTSHCTSKPSVALPLPDDAIHCNASTTHFDSTPCPYITGLSNTLPKQDRTELRNTITALVTAKPCPQPCRTLLYPCENQPRFAMPSLGLTLSRLTLPLRVQTKLNHTPPTRSQT